MLRMGRDDWVSFLYLFVQQPVVGIKNRDSPSPPTCLLMKPLSMMQFCDIATAAAVLLLAATPAARADSTSFIRVNQVGYLPDAPKVAVVCTLDSAVVRTFVVTDARGRVVLGPKRTMNDGRFGPCLATLRLDFS